MNTKRILGIILFVLGIASLLVSNYISTQVAEGKLKIAKGQKTVDQSNQLFSLNPVTKQVGKGMTGSAQNKIDKGKQQVRDYEAIAHGLHVGGIIVAVIGVGIFAISFMGQKPKKRR